MRLQKAFFWHIRACCRQRHINTFMQTREQSSYNTIWMKLRTQDALCDWLDQFGCNFFVTANFNCETTEQSARAALRRWHSMIDRKFFGPKWHKKPNEQRTFFAAFPEHPYSNRHFHMMLKTNVPWEFVRYAELAWIKIVPSGSMDIKLVDQIQDRRVTTGYSTKHVWKYDLMEQFIISSEFSTPT